MPNAPLSSSSITPSTFFTGAFTGPVTEKQALLIKKIISVAPYSNSLMDRSLKELALNVCAQSMQKNFLSAPDRIDSFLFSSEDLPRELRTLLTDKMGVALCKIKSPYHVAMLIATSRASSPNNKTPCNVIAHNHNIKHPDDIMEIELAAVTDGGLGERVRNGEPCEKVALESGIRDDRTLHKLSHIALDGRAGERIRNGESCDLVSREHELCVPRYAIELIAINGKAGERVRNGEPCNIVASEHGITTLDGIGALNRVAINGKAGARVRNGEPCNIVGSEHGIILRYELELVSVNTVAGERVRNGEPYEVVAAGLGIRSLPAQIALASAARDIALASAARDNEMILEGILIGISDGIKNVTREACSIQ